MIGPPGSGKGTHGPSIKNKLCLCHLATGDMLRQAISAGTELGREADEIMRKGELVPDSLVVSLLAERLDESECSKGVLLDGFPRTLEQAKELDKLFKTRNMHIDLVVEFAVDEELLIERIEGRRIHQPSGRSYHLIHNPPMVPNLDDLTGEPLIHRKDDTREALS